MRKYFSTFIILVFLSTVSFAQSGNSYLIKAGKLFNSSTGTFAKNMQILVKDNKIVEVNENISPKGSVTIIDLSSYTIIPGLIDAHTHILEEFAMNKNNTAGTLENLITKDDAYRALRSVSRLQSYLNYGFTTIKDVGNSGLFLDVSLKRALKDGLIHGPRMITAGPIMSSVGGQFPGMRLEYHDLPAKEYRIIKDPDDARYAVREHINYGADVIKICADNSPNNTALTFDEIKAIVETAHKFNLKVSAHANKPSSILDALNAGVDGIDHGYSITDELLILMEEKGTYLIPTDYHVAPIGIKYHKLNGWNDKKVNARKSKLHHRLYFALKNNVKIAFGSDIYVDFLVPRGKAAQNVFHAYLDAGLSPVEVLKTATYNAADFLGMKNKLGIIKSGAIADIVAVKGDLEIDFKKAIDSVKFVMKEGKIEINKTDN